MAQKDRDFIRHEYNYHEAGHTLIAWMRDVRFKAGVIETDKGISGYVLSDPHAPYVHGVAESLIASLAGCDAQSELTGEDWFTLLSTNGLHDQIDINNRVALLSDKCDAKKIARTCHKYSTLAVQTHWQEISKIAELFRVHNSIDDVLVRKCLGHYSPDKFLDNYVIPALEESGLLEVADLSVYLS